MFEFEHCNCKVRCVDDEIILIALKVGANRGYYFVGSGEKVADAFANFVAGHWWLHAATIGFMVTLINTRLSFALQGSARRDWFTRAERDQLRRLRPTQRPL